MRDALWDIVHSRRRGRICWMEDVEGLVVAWGLLLWRKDHGDPEIMLYTHPDMKGQGYASQIFWALRNTLEDTADGGAKYVFYPHSPEAESFYLKMFEKRQQGKRLYPIATILQP